MAYFKHVMKQAGFDHLAVTGKTEGSKGKGIPRRGFMKSLRKWANTTKGEMIKPQMAERCGKPGPPAICKSIIPRKREIESQGERDMLERERL